MASAEAWRLIHCVVFGGASRPFLSRLAREKDIWNVFYTGARRAAADHTRTRGRIARFVENEEIFILVPAERTAEIMEFCWLQLEMDQPGRGVINIIDVTAAHPFVMPEGTLEAG
ncbi:hypothetical protein [Magnetospirillum sp. UT-4]|uniref:hypothetical protein n=1 Tax=Magnetospirillum sp. UT-4 TaxID=2681467 RepID=UPI001381053D|nr:hypothetical protein [Magnetospirillum sp. UT-4]CAA7622648.1 hypothetical protein MTBUT4_430025 [Magnetospirillum sp. UT-4]